MENNQFEADRLLFVNQMETLLRKEMLPEALSMSEQRFSRFPFDVDARAYINLVMIEMGRIEESRNILQGLEKDIASLSFVYLRTANAYRERGLNPDAVLCYQKFLSLNPLAENAQEVAEKIALLQEKEHQTENNESEDADSLGPEFYTLTLADLYIKQGHSQIAADILTEIIKREPANDQARVKLEAVEAALALKSYPGGTVPSVNNLITTLSCWLSNIGRLKNHAT